MFTVKIAGRKRKDFIVCIKKNRVKEKKRFQKHS